MAIVRSGQSFPALTKQGVQNLIKQLDDDLTTVQGNPGAGATLKSDVQTLVAEVEIKLKAALADNGLPLGSGWVAPLAAEFHALGKLLQQGIVPPPKILPST